MSAEKKPEINFDMHEEEHASADEGDGNWIMSYADMMTLLMAFFAIMFSFSTIDQGKFDKVREEIAKKFGGKIQMPFEDIQKALEMLIAQENFKDKVLVKQDGSGIYILFQGSVFFEPGDVKIQDESNAVLNKILDVVEEKAKGYPIHIEGHTDDAPIATAHFPSNWELSAARASLVVRMLESRKFSKEFLSAQGFADSQPLVPNRDADGKPILENQAQNRRVIIKITRANK
jgi:chemotaxis protein MotB